jgi:hypothetical protein
MTNPDPKPKSSTPRVAKHEAAQREAGRVQRKRWAHPDDWPEIDRVIDRLNKARTKKPA